jgi:hypothetical protein
VQYNHKSETLDALTKDHEKLLANLNILNNVKNQKEEELGKKIKEYELLSSKFE